MTTRTRTSVVLAHVALSVIDLERARTFYVDVLGLEEAPRPEFSVPGAWLTTGAGMIHLAQVASIPEPRDQVSHFALQVPTDQIASLTEAVERAGGSVLMAPRLRDDLGASVTSAILRDTEGNKFELTDLGQPTP
ncbi:MAG: Glyoxalase/bleomycin resistance protein/dioxygenase [Mycobacterium sp.]|nr:Glyoxalase/bleomycin resistance protein/dioxygenase [Mycobacterium sp.]